MPPRRHSAVSIALLGVLSGACTSGAPTGTGPLGGAGNASGTAGDTSVAQNGGAGPTAGGSTGTTTQGASGTTATPGGGASSSGAGGGGTGNEAAGTASVPGGNGSGGDESDGTAGAGEGGAVNGAAGGGASGGGTAGSGGALPACLNFAEPVQVGTAEAPELTALSGFVASRQTPGVLFAHADAGDSDRVWAMDETGATLATFTLVGAPGQDWEDIAVAQGDGGAWFVFVADIGDNAAGGMGQGTVRDEISVIRFAEPTVTLGQAPVETDVTDFDVLRFTYPDTPYNAEGLAVDPVTGDILILTKVTSGESALFRAPADTPPDTPTMLEKVADVATGVAATAADMSPTGDRFLARTTSGALLWKRAEPFAATFAATPVMLTSPDESQPEGVTFSADGSAWLSSGEVDPVIFRADATCP